MIQGTHNSALHTNAGSDGTEPSDFRKGREWIALCFDLEGRIVSRTIEFGLFSECARQVYIAADSRERGFELGAAILTDASLSPDELSACVRDALALKLPPEMGYWLASQWKGQWIREARATKLR